MQHRQQGLQWESLLCHSQPLSTFTCTVHSWTWGLFRPSRAIKTIIKKQTLSDVQHARWIQPSAQFSPAAPHPSCLLWPGDRPSWPPHILHRWRQFLLCPSTSFPKLRMHHWQKKRKKGYLQHLAQMQLSSVFKMCHSLEPLHTCNQRWNIKANMFTICNMMPNHRRVVLQCTICAWSLAALMIRATSAVQLSRNSLWKNLTLNLACFLHPDLYQPAPPQRVLWKVQFTSTSEPTLNHLTSL